MTFCLHHGEQHKQWSNMAARLINDLVLICPCVSQSQTSCCFFASDITALLFIWKHSRTSHPGEGESLFPLLLSMNLLTFGLMSGQLGQRLTEGAFSPLSVWSEDYTPDPSTPTRSKVCVALRHQWTSTNSGGCRISELLLFNPELFSFTVMDVDFSFFTSQHAEAG